MRIAAASALGYLREGVFADLSPEKGDVVTLRAGDFKALRSPGVDVSDELFDLISSSYSKIGGHANVTSAADIPGDSDYWEIIDVDADPEPDVVNFGKTTSHGRKNTGSATDGGAAAKKELLDRKVAELHKAGNYGEVSGAIAHILLTRHSVPFVNSQAEVERVLGKKVKWIGEDPKYPGYDGWYERAIGGHAHAKIMVGKPR